jgi:F-type H+-transporting ATPase subunit epsilon
MQLSVLLPERVVLERPARKIVAEGESGSFGLLPRHIDFTESLVPGILSFVDADSDEEVFLAVDEGVLVKCGREVLVSVRNAVLGPELGTLEQTVRERFQRVTEHERAMRSALAKLEADVVRRFLEIG